MTASVLKQDPKTTQLNPKHISDLTLHLIFHHLTVDEVLLNVLRCQLTYEGQAETNAEAWFNKCLRPRKPEGSLGRTAQDGHLDSHTAPELCRLTVV